MAQASIDNHHLSIENHGIALQKLGNSYTGLRQGKVVACSGITIMWKGVAELWMYLGKDTFKDKRLALRIFKLFMDKAQQEHNLHRLQAVVKTDFKDGHRFAKFYGFVNEGIMRNYGPGKESFNRYAKCWLGQ